MKNSKKVNFRPLLILIPLLTPAPIPTPTPSIKPAGSMAYRTNLGEKRKLEVYAGRKNTQILQQFCVEKSRVVVTRLLTAITTTLGQPLTCLQSCIQGAGFKNHWR